MYEIINEQVICRCGKVDGCEHIKVTECYCLDSTCEYKQYGYRACWNYGLDSTIETAFETHRGSLKIIFK